jgi:predicted MFS family arabinose efflux permease
MRLILNAGLIAMTLGYTLSQFYRAFLAVLSSTLQAELGASPGDLALSSGMWFLGFALMQMPVGWALDHVGPRRTSAALLALGGGGGAAIFALATEVWHLHVAMALIGAGCAPALMAAYYIIAHEYPRAGFAGLTGMIVGFGSLGNILGAAPLVSLIHAIGWREALWLLTAATIAVAALQWMIVRDPHHENGKPRGSVIEILGLRVLWLMLPLFAVSYAASAAIRGLWAGPYLRDVFGATDTVVGRATLVMGIAMVIGNLAAGPFVRLCRSLRKAVILGHGLAIGALAGLVLLPGESLALSVALLGAVGLVGTNYALLMAHARGFLPPHLLGRGVTFLNMVSIGGVGIMQFASRPLHGAGSAALAPPGAYAMLFLFFLVPLVVGALLYLRAPEAAYD